MLIDLEDKTGNIEKTRICNVYKLKEYYALLTLNVVIGFRATYTFKGGSS